MMKLIFIFSAAVLFSSGCKDTTYKRKKIGADIVEAKFIKDSLIDGEAKFYDLDGKINSKANYTMGIKNGVALTYYGNGKTKDSSNYTNNLLNGNVFIFDKNGSLVSRTTYYYGLNVGDNFLYYHNNIYEYSFDDFVHKELLKCKYDSVGNCKYLFFDVRPVITTVYSSITDSANSFFLFFPHPPDFVISYNMGLINDKGVKEKEFVLNSDRIFVDTVFTFPPQGWKYFISIDYKSISNDSLINVVNKKF